MSADAGSRKRAGLFHLALGALLICVGGGAAGCGGTRPPSAVPPPSGSAESSRGAPSSLSSPAAGVSAPGVAASPAPNPNPGSSQPSAVAPLPPPVLVALSPTEGPPGTVLRLQGYHFGERPGRVALLSASGGKAVALAIERWTPDAVEAMVPKGLESGRYSPELWDAQGREAGPAGSGAWPEFDLVGPPPVVDHLAPTVAPAGTLVEIDGQNFGDRPGRVVFVQFWGTPAATYTTAPIVSWAADKVVVRSPGGQNGMARIRLTTAAGQGVWAGTVVTGGPAGNPPSGAVG